MAEKLTLSDGTVWEDASAILSGNLFLYINGQGMRNVFNKLIEPGNTGEIEYTRINGETVTYAGYTKLAVVSDEGSGLVTAVLKREVD